MAELVDALDSKSSSFGSVGSIPTLSTDKSKASENRTLAFLFLWGFDFQIVAFEKKIRREWIPILPIVCCLYPPLGSLFIHHYFPSHCFQGYKKTPIYGYWHTLLFFVGLNKKKWSKTGSPPKLRIMWNNWNRNKIKSKFEVRISNCTKKTMNSEKS